MILQSSKFKHSAFAVKMTFNVKKSTRIGQFWKQDVCYCNARELTSMIRKDSWAVEFAVAITRLRDSRIQFQKIFVFAKTCFRYSEIVRNRPWILVVSNGLLSCTVDFDCLKNLRWPFMIQFTVLAQGVERLTNFLVHVCQKSASTNWDTLLLSFITHMTSDFDRAY